jgi:hypothetical protein
MEVLVITLKSLDNSGTSKDDALTWMTTSSQSILTMTSSFLDVMPLEMERLVSSRRRGCCFGVYFHG